MSLENLRKNLSLVDKQLVETIAKRQEIVSQIGEFKRSSGTGTRDYAREKDVLNMGRKQAEDLGVDPDLIEAFLKLLIQASLESQERERVAAEGKGDGSRVLIIGGAGKMGQWFVDFFNSQGYAVTIADTSVKNSSNSFTSWKDAGLNFEFIVVATPLAISGRILEELAISKPDGLIFDIGSLKSPLICGLEKLKKAGCSVTSLHPMFGPETRLLSDHHLIFCDVGDHAATATVKKLFSSTMVKQLDMGLDDHDRLIAYVLGLSHALNIAFFTALAESGEKAPLLAKMSSTTFDSQLLVSTAVAKDNPHLYFEIQKLNKFGLGSIDALCDAVFKIRKTIEDNNEEAFIELMKSGRDYLSLRE